jgi:hypothetical protein
MAESLEVIELQNEIERLDREWAQKEAGYISHGKNGPHRPSSSLFGLAFGIFFACMCFGMAVMMFNIAGSFHGGFSAIGLIPAGMGVFAIVAAVMNMNKGVELERAESAHQARRAKLLAKLKQARS